MGNADPSRKSHRLNSPESARGHRLFLALSLSLNAVLLLFLLFVCRTPAPKGSTGVQFKTNTVQESRGIIRKDFKREAAPAAPISQWSQLESSDLSVYAANLRAAGCPEKTVRDILLPWIEESFDAEHALAEPTNFWASFSQRQKAEAAHAERERTLEEEREKALKELLGFAWTSQGLKHAYEGEAAIFLGFLDFEHAEKLVCIADRFEKKFSWSDSLVNRRNCRLAFYNTLRKELADVLSPAEFEEAELRAILIMSHIVRNPNIFKAGLSGSELRLLIALKRDLCNPIQSALLEGGDQLSQEQHLASEQEFNRKARSLLGDNRFLDYLQSCDSSIERTLGVLEKEHLPRSMALQLFDLRQDTLSQAAEIRNLPARRSEKRAQLAALRQSAIEQINALYNSETNNPLIKINHDWLQETANP